MATPRWMDYPIVPSFDPAPAPRIIAIGELLWDVLPSGPRLGGATTNFAVLSATLGSDTSLVSCIGTDALGEEAMRRLKAIEEHLHNAGPERSPLDLSCVRESATMPTGTVAVSLTADGHPQYTIHAPAAWDEIELDATLIDRSAHAEAIYFGTLAQRAMPSRLTLHALVESAPKTCLRICDLNLRSPFLDPEVVRWSVLHCDVLKVSDEELPLLSTILGWPPIPATDESDDTALTSMAAAATESIFQFAPRCSLTAVTLGGRGSYIADRTRGLRHRGFPAKVQDTVGAGDAFTAGLLFACLRGATLEQMSVVANRCGSFVASQSGATPEFPPALLGELQGALS